MTFRDHATIWFLSGGSFWFWSCIFVFLLKNLFFVSTYTGFDISCKLSPLETICMKWQNLSFLAKIREIFQYLICWNFTQSAEHETFPFYILRKPTVLGPVVQSVVSLMSSLRVISLTVLADSIYNILIFFAEKNVSSFCTAKATHIFSAKNFSIFAYHSI